MTRGVKPPWRRYPALALALAPPLIMLVGILAIALFSSAGPKQRSAETHATTIAHEDERAYEELRKRGFSEQEARDAAASTRRLCEAAGGTDCQ
jgi:hypothetical protein